MSSDSETKSAADTIGKTVFCELISEQSPEQARVDFQQYQRYMQSLPLNPVASAYLAQCDMKICGTT